MGLIEDERAAFASREEFQITGKRIAEIASKVEREYRKEIRDIGTVIIQLRQGNIAECISYVMSQHTFRFPHGADSKINTALDALFSGALIDCLRKAGMSARRKANENADKERLAAYDAIDNWLISAINGLSEIGGGKAVKSMLSAAGNKHFSKEVRIAALKALAGAKGAAIVPHFLKMLRVSDTDDFQRGVWQAIASIGEPAIPPLRAGIDDDYALSKEVIHCAPAGILAHMGDVESVPFIIAGLGGNFNITKISCAYALGELKDSRAVGPLVKLLEDHDSTVSKSACEALGRIGDVSALIPLLEYYCRTKYLGASRNILSLVDIDTADSAIMALMVEKPVLRKELGILMLDLQFYAESVGMTRPAQRQNLDISDLHLSRMALTLMRPSQPQQPNPALAARKLLPATA